MSRPPWARELKLAVGDLDIRAASVAPPWARELKHLQVYPPDAALRVAPPVGA